MNSGTELVNALLFGKLDGLSPETISLFTRTGLIHLFSASGFHMAAAVQLARVTSRLFFFVPGRGKAALSFALQLSLMIFFAQATAWSSPMVRAFTFTTLLSLARILEIFPNRHWVFLLSLLLSATLGKGSLLSFTLSAAGMAGILYIRPQNFWTHSLGPWLVTAPIVVWVFGMFSLSAPLWNLVAGNLIAWLVMPPAILHLFCDCLSVPDPFLPLASTLMGSITEMLSRGDSFLGGSFWVPAWPFEILLTLAATSLLLPRHGRGLATILCFLALFLPPPRLALLDVGQGDSLFFRLANGKKILMDMGPPRRRGDAPVQAALARIGQGDLNEILLSHLDLDHRGGLETLLRTRVVHGSLWLREENLGSQAAGIVLELTERAALPVKFIQENSAPEGMECFLAPALNTNDSSPLCVATLSGKEKIWLTGDMSTRTEEWLLQKALPPAKFLKVAHHGSRTSSSEAFLKASGAAIALVSVGEKNRYGHPTQETLSRLREQHMKIYRTDQEGTVSFY